MKNIKKLSQDQLYLLVDGLFDEYLTKPVNELKAKLSDPFYLDAVHTFEEMGKVLQYLDPQAWTTLYLGNSNDFSNYDLVQKWLTIGHDAEMEIDIQLTESFVEVQTHDGEICLKAA